MARLDPRSSTGETRWLRQERSHCWERGPSKCSSHPKRILRCYDRRLEAQFGWHRRGSAVRIVLKLGFRNPVEEEDLKC